MHDFLPFEQAHVVFSLFQGEDPDSLDSMAQELAGARADDEVHAHGHLQGQLRVQCVGWGHHHSL